MRGERNGMSIAYEASDVLVTIQDFEDCRMNLPVGKSEC